MKRLIKSALLWLNAWRFKCSEDDAAHFQSQRLNLSAHESRERIKQRKLRIQRDRFNQW
jgi:hypothetical protein